MIRCEMNGNCIHGVAELALYTINYRKCRANENKYIINVYMTGLPLIITTSNTSLERLQISNVSLRRRSCV